jgi:hypothetical protein
VAPVRASVLLLALFCRQEAGEAGPWSGFGPGSWVETEQKREGRETLPPDYIERTLLLEAPKTAPPTVNVQLWRGGGCHTVQVVAWKSVR